MSDGTLDDLILTDPEPEGGKSKSVLALLALIVVLIIIGAVLAKMIFSSPDDNNNTTTNTTEIKKDLNTKNSIDANSNNSKNAKSSDNLDADLTPLDDNTMPSNVETVTVNDKSKSDKNKVTNNSDSMNINNEKNNLNLNTNDNEPTVKHKEKKIENIVKHKAKPKPKPKHTTHIYGGHGNVYIQVGSFSKGPNEKFINKIIKAGFKYRIKEANGFRRVYVGPFTSSEASRVLGKVKAKISPSAFIKK